MPDDKHIRGPADAARINIHEPHELIYWSAKLGCNQDQLVAAVRAVGVMAMDVREQLERRRRQSPA